MGDASEDTTTTDAANDAATRFCQTLSPAPAFCADFDDPLDANAASGWNLSYAGIGSTVKFESPFLSSPRAFHASGTQGNGAYLERSLMMTTQLSVELDVRFAYIPPDGTEVSPIVLTPPNPPGEDIFWFCDANNSYFQEFSQIDASGAPPTLNVWHHLEVSLTTDGSTTIANSKVDGVGRWVNKTLPFAWPSPTTATVRVGVARTYATTNDVYVDNVVIRTQ